MNFLRPEVVLIYTYRHVSGTPGLTVAMAWVSSHHAFSTLLSLLYFFLVQLALGGGGRVGEVRSQSVVTSCSEHTSFQFRNQRGKESFSFPAPGRDFGESRVAAHYD